MSKKFSIRNISKVVREVILPKLQTYTIFAFIGPLGSGKTTMIKEILRQCGVQGVVNSPTFSYVNSYQGANHITFNHFDLYRIDSTETFIQAGFDEYLYQANTINFIEWPEIIAPLLKIQKLQKHVCYVTLAYDQNDLQMRMIKL